MAKSIENIINWHPEAVKLHARLEDELATIIDGNKEYEVVVEAVRKAIAGVIWREGNRALKESNQAWVEGDHETANEIAFRVMGLDRAQDIASGDYK